MFRSTTTALAAGVAIGAVVVLATTMVVSDPGGVAGSPSGTGPAVGGAPDGVAFAAGLETSSSCDELGERMGTMVRRVIDEGGGIGWFGERAAALSGADEMTEDAGAEGAFSADASGDDSVTGDATNVQEAGVDEPDIVEVVGDVTVVGTQGVLRIVDVAPDGSPVVLGELPLGDWGELELLGIGEDRLAVIVRDVGDPVRPATDRLVEPSFGSTSVVLVDLADPTAPRELSRVDSEGWLVDARAVDGVVRLAVRSDGPQVNMPLLMESMVDGPRTTEQAEDAAMAAAGAVLDRLDGAAWQPHARVTAADGTSEVVPLVPCDRIGVPSSFAGTGTLTLAVIDATGDELAVDDAVSVVTGGEQLYSTADRLVVASTRWAPCCDDVVVDEPGPEIDPFFEEGAPGDEPLAAGDAAGATAVAGSMAMIEPGWWGRGEATDLHVFDVEGTVVSHVGSGSVDGWLLNQFSMSLHEDVLRVATTTADDRGVTSSAVTTLRVEGDELVQLGSVGDLGPNEDIQSVRFMGDVAYVVTFRRTDPLYVVDLADPAAPRTLGELKIEGYSAYLHPLRDGLLLGVGQDADPATGVTEGVQVSTFDVTDPTSPTRVDVDVTPDSGSAVEWDHHALTVTRAGTVLVPVEQWGFEGGEARLGVLVYEVADDGSLVEVGVLDVGTRWELAPRRTVDLGDVILVVGDQGVTTWDARTFQPLGSEVFPAPTPR